MKIELYIQRKNDETLAALFEGDRLIECHVETAELCSHVGNIYRGKVRRVVPEMDAAFIDIGLNKTALLDLRDAVDLKRNHQQEISITDIVSEGETVWVQVIKDAVLNKRGLADKGVRVTTKLQIESPYFIYFEQGSHIGASKKVDDEELRSQRITDVQEWQNENAKTGGCIIRTEAFSLTEEPFYKELERLFLKAEELSSLKREASKIGLVYQPFNFVEKMLNAFKALNNECVISDQGNSSLDIETRLKEKQFYTQIESAHQSLVELESGASLVIESTEALISVDVNTGSAFESGLSILDVNLEALTELAYQLKLRKLAGVVFVDFVNMKKQADIKKLVNRAKQTFMVENSGITVHGMTKLGFLELSIKRVSPSLSDMSKLSSLLMVTKH